MIMKGTSVEPKYAKSNFKMSLFVLSQRFVGYAFFASFFRPY